MPAYMYVYAHNHDIVSDFDKTPCRKRYTKFRRDDDATVSRKVSFDEISGNALAFPCCVNEHKDMRMCISHV